MQDNREQRRKIYNTMRSLRDKHDLVPFVTLKYLSEKQEEYKDNLGEFMDKYGFYFRDYELFSCIAQKQEAGDDSYLSDFKSSINALKNSSNQYIKEIYSNIPDKTLKDEIVEDIVNILKFHKDSRRLYLEIKGRFPLMFSRSGNISPVILKEMCKIVQEDHNIRNVYNPTSRDAEIIRYLENFETATLYEKDEQLYYHAIQNMIINNIPMDKITIANKEIIVDDNNTTYDAIISVPYEDYKSGKTSDLSGFEKFIEFKTRNPNSLHLLNLIEHLSEDGILVTVTSLDLLVKKDAYALRKCLMDRNIIDSIIEYDRSYRNDNNIILIIKKNKKNENILFIKRDDEYSVRPRMRPRNISEFYKNRSKVNRLTEIITNDEIVENDYNLNPKRYVYTLDYEPKDFKDLTDKQQEYTSQIRQLDGEIDELLDKIRKL